MSNRLVSPRRFDYAQLSAQGGMYPYDAIIRDVNLAGHAWEFRFRRNQEVNPPPRAVRHGLHSTNALSLRAVQPQVFTDLEIRRDVAHCRPLINNRSL